jgi:hypothetical protein
MMVAVSSAGVSSMTKIVLGTGKLLVGGQPDTVVF